MRDLPPVGLLEALYLEGRMPPRVARLWERLAWALDVEPQALGGHLARLGLPGSGWILVVAQVGWRPGATPPGAEILAEEGLVDPRTRTLTRKGRVVLELLEDLYRWATAQPAVAGRLPPV